MGFPLLLLQEKEGGIDPSPVSSERQAARGPGGDLNAQGPAEVALDPVWECLTRDGHHF